MQKITIETEYITLSAFLKFAGAVMSGGDAKDKIANGSVCVNHAVCIQKGKKLYGGEIVTMGGESYEVVCACI